ncbi:hypothetical protein Q31b_14290 [Novipirellula aureliae]|uniref:Uncharacterized protein n=1 Tax=Novipirellula aureliae TaxID=2527966 RepID=A0A5C6E7G8_9BACT|nr:hypothetical protein Q31b_14290 [Novipirellula aureliae]
MLFRGVFNLVYAYRPGFIVSPKLEAWATFSGPSGLYKFCPVPGLRKWNVLSHTVPPCPAPLF